jgi:hypothetical protein
MRGPRRAAAIRSDTGQVERTGALSYSKQSPDPKRPKNFVGIVLTRPAACTSVSKSPRETNSRDLAAWAFGR